jgi:hypothetical protein
MNAGVTTGIEPMSINYTFGYFIIPSIPYSVMHIHPGISIFSSFGAIYMIFYIDASIILSKKFNFKV